MNGSGTSDLADLLAGEMDWLHRLARSLLSDPTEAADLAQDAAVVTLTRAPSLSGNSMLMRGWLRAVTRRLAQASRRKAHGAPESVDIEPEASCEEFARQRLHTQQRVLDCVMSLDEPYRSTLVMRYFDDLPPRQIAQQKGLPSATVRQHLSRGLKLLRAGLDGEFGDRNQWQLAFLLIAMPLPRSSRTLPLLGGFTAMGIKQVASLVLVVGLILIGSYSINALWAAGTPEVGSFAENYSIQMGNPSAQDTAKPIDQAARSGVNPKAPVMVRSVFEVLNPEGVRMQGVNVLAWRVDQHGRVDLRKAESDAQGLVVFADLSGRGAYAVQLEGHVPVFLEVEELADEHTVVIGKGRELSGIVRLDGDAPNHQVHLRIVPHGGSNYWPRVLSQRGITRGIEALTDIKGRFRVRGFGSMAKVMLWYLEGQCVDIRGAKVRRQGTGLIFVDRIQTDLQIDLVSVPTLELKFVWEDTGAPVEDLRVKASAQLSSAGQRNRATGTTSADGMLTLQIRHGANHLPENTLRRLREVTSASLNIHRPDLSPGKSFELSSEQDLSQRITLRLPREWHHPAHVCHFLVVDELGNAVPGARLSRDHSGSEPTDDRGRGRIEFSEDQRKEFLLGARGMGICRVTIEPKSGMLGEPLRLVLEKSNRLEIEVVLPVGHRHSDYELLVRPKGPLFQFSKTLPSWPSWLQSRLAGSEFAWTMRTTKAGEATLCCKLADDGRIEFKALRPEVATALTLQDRLGTILVEKQVDGLGDRELRRETIELDGQGQDLRIQLVDPNGKPAAAVNVLLFLAGRKHGHTIQSDERGIARMTGVHASLDRVTFCVSGGGCLRLPLAPVTAYSMVVPVVKPRPLFVRLIDQEGQEAPLPKFQLFALATSGTLQVGNYTDGVPVFDSVPGGPVEIRTRVGAELLSSPPLDPALTATGRRQVTWTVPSTGRLEVIAPRLAGRQGLVRLKPVIGETRASKAVQAQLKPNEAHGSSASTIGFFPCLFTGRYLVELLAPGPRGSQPSVVKRAEVSVIAGKASLLDLR